MHESRSGAALPAQGCRFASPMRIVCVVLTTFVLVPLSVAQTLEEQIVENGLTSQSLVTERALVDLQGLLSPVVRNASIGRLAVLAGGGQAASVGEPGKLVYSNTRGSFAFGPSGGAGFRIADGIVTTAVDGCSLDRYVVRVTGDKDGSGDTRPFTVTMALYDNCPGAEIDPTPIPGSAYEITLVPTQVGELHDVEYVIPLEIDIPLPTTLYVAVTLSRENAGWIAGAPAEQGFSANRFDFPNFPCDVGFFSFPGFPYASFYAKVYVRECESNFPVYYNTRQSGSFFTLGRLNRFGDDITLSRSDCKMMAYEVSVKGSCSTCSGGFSVDLKTDLSDSNPNTGNRIPRTAGVGFISTDEVQVFHYEFDPPIPVPQSFFITFATDTYVVGPIVTGRVADIGDTTDTYVEYQGEAPTGQWALKDLGVHTWSAFDVTIFCEGQPPVGACCDTISTNETGDPVCRERPEMNCPADLWIEAQVCDPDPFEPNCGMGACCTFDGQCLDLTERECDLLSSELPGARYLSTNSCSSACPFGACRENTDCDEGFFCNKHFCAEAQCFGQQKLTASDAGRWIDFGGALSVSGDTAVVGAKSPDDCGVLADCEAEVYILRFDGTAWVETQKLAASDGAGGFGRSVSVSGDTVVVGAPFDGCAAVRSCGSAYVFRFNGTEWIEEQKLTASDAAAHDWFGSSVSITGNTVLVGAQLDDHDACFNCGSVYAFRFNGTSWVEVQRLSASDAEFGDLFGSSLSMTANTAVVGTTGHNCATGGSCGSVYVFQYNGTLWFEDQRLTASDASRNDLFGKSVSVSGAAIVVGARQADCSGGFFCGAAYVFRFDGAGWIEEQRLTAADVRTRDNFGWSVSLSGDTIVVGAFLDDCADGDDCGSAYVFHFDGVRWVEEQKLTAADASTRDKFGSSVAVNGDRVLVGAGGDDCPVGFQCGAVYVFACDLASTVASIDIKPGGCRNLVNPKSQGVLPVAILGSADFDVATVDPGSLMLARADGVGEGVSPLSNRRGFKIIVKDVATPFEGEPCGCHDFGGDGLDDLTLTFSTPQMARAFGLNELSKGETIELVLRGTLQDGTNFEARDCITIPGSRRTSSELRRTRTSK